MNKKLQELGEALDYLELVRYDWGQGVKWCLRDHTDEGIGGGDSEWIGTTPEETVNEAWAYLFVAEKEKTIHAGQVIGHIGQRAAVAIPAITAEQVRARIAEIKAERPLSDKESGAILEFLCNAPVAGTVEETDG